MIAQERARQYLKVAGGPLRDALEAALDGEAIGFDAAATIARADGGALQAVIAVADALREEHCGDVVTYVVNRNVNFTNVCIKHCTFCAFSREFRAEQGYFLPIDEVVRRAREARDYGATEVCIQAGLAPKMDPNLYTDLCRALKRELPELHIHAFSPEEIQYGSIRAGVSIPEFIAELKDAGLDTIPGTSAEILDQKIRDRIAPGRISRDAWIEVITSAHAAGISTTATILYGHIEAPEDWVRHMILLRELQAAGGRFTEFVPLSFIPDEAPMHFRKLVPEARRGPTGREVVAMHALARILLGPSFRNIQTSWVKEGMAFSSYLLQAGVNDLGGTLINESISTSAGAQHGQLQSPRSLRDWIRRAGRVPAERSTRYDIRRKWEVGEADTDHSALDDVQDSEAVFGSYRELSESDRFRFEHPSLAARPG